MFRIDATQYRNEQRKQRIKDFGCDPYQAERPQYSFQKIKRSSSMELLDLFPPITMEDIKRAYRKMAKLYHPDKGGCSDKFIAVNDAYNELLITC